MVNQQTRANQPVGFAVDEWQAPPYPPRTPMLGHYCELQPLNFEEHAADLYDAFRKDSEHRNWTYLPYGPFDDFESFAGWLKQSSQSEDPMFFAILETKTGDKKTAKAVGVASYLRIDPPVGVIEVGHIHYSPLLQKTPLATEAMFLMMQRVFDELGYRRYEWKCDALNEGSVKAAGRLGFEFEGIFRQATMYKGRNRDTAWFSIIDKEWPELKAAFEHWLNPANFDDQGQQLSSLKTASKTEYNLTSQV